ncbi:DegT/DnrJ/EryC1/StrS family aminotransferase [Methylophilus sp.]|uniref:DegT/DnrJ/EryC1/StrS family aminotransferase n=1 Tax=Methylophilus sp. TaxID=29541 RepID=UPI000D431F09|nr:DegT/DnrJ/EryC1/StrS family aminotransferase [Methylophilus sp.]PPD11850.1 MAG: erythromycin biosynthesis sensory transduction protein eryC1 [Methylophilus sp.]
MIPFLDLKAAYDELSPALESAILRATRSGWYIAGVEVEKFEQQFAHFVGANHCVGLGNGLDALTLSLRALDVGPGDEVIVPSNTYIATWLAVSAVGATVVPVEPAVGQYNIDAHGIRQKLTGKTKVILPVHLYGIPANMDEICALAREKGLYVLEDAAQAHGAAINHRRIGAHGDVVAWSFYPGKNLGALGDGGAVTTNRPELANRIRMLGNYGSAVKYFNEEMGVNSRLDPVQAAVLSIKLNSLDEWNMRRTRIAERYIEGLAGLPLQLPQILEGADAVWHLFVVATPKRDALQKYLHTQEIQTLIHYPVPPHLQNAYRHLQLTVGNLPLAEAYAAQVLSLPMGPQLSMADVNVVIQAIRTFFARAGKA